MSKGVKEIQGELLTAIKPRLNSVSSASPCKRITSLNSFAKRYS